MSAEDSPLSTSTDDQLAAARKQIEDERAVDLKKIAELERQLPDDKKRGILALAQQTIQQYKEGVAAQDEALRQINTEMKKRARKSSPLKTGKLKTGSTKTGKLKTGSTKTGKLKTGSAKTGKLKTGSAKTGKLKTGSTKTGKLKTGSLKKPAANKAPRKVSRSPRKKSSPPSKSPAKKRDDSYGWW